MLWQDHQFVALLLVGGHQPATPRAGLAGAHICCHKDAKHTFNHATEALDDLNLILAFMGQAGLADEAIANTGGRTFLANLRPRAREAHEWTVEFIFTADRAGH